MRAKIVLFFLLFSAFFLRVYRLDHLELFGDEVDVGYQAYSLWQTGRDYLGNRLPLYIHSFSEWRAPLLMYLTAPFVALLGLNELGVRSVPVFCGLLNIFLIYFLVKLLTKKEKLALISGFVLAFSPWHIHYSRTGFEVTLLLSLILLGTIFFVLEKWFFSALFFGLSFYAYNTANVFLPLWLLILVFVFRKKIKREKIVFPLIIFSVFFLAIVFNAFFGQGSARFKLISIFNNPKTIDRIVFQRTTGLENGLIERVFHNKLTGWGKEFLTNYLTAFSPQFLFLTGDPNPRHNPPGSGEFYWFFLPFLLMGVFELAKSKDRVFKTLIFSWLFLGPVPASLTVGGGNQATRLFLSIVPLSILISIGLEMVFKGLGKIIVFGLVGLGLIFWLHNYFVHYLKEEYQWWHYGYKGAMTWVKDQEDDYQRILINNQEPGLVRYLFWTKKDLAWFWDNFQGDEIKEDILPGFNGFKLGRVYFGIINQEDKLAWLEENLDSQSLYFGFQGEEVPGDWDWSQNPPSEFKVLKTINSPWGKPMSYWLARE